MTAFRQAEASDISFILGLLREFYRKAGSVYGIPFDGPSTIITIGEVMRKGVCLVGPTSCAGALVLPFPYSYKARVANVVFWYFKSSREIKIFDELMAACKTAGATHIIAASHPPHHTIAKLYQRKQLLPSESWFIRLL